MDKEICLQFIDHEIIELFHKRNELRKACQDANFPKMQRIVASIQFGPIERLNNLIGRDRYEDWGRVAAKEMKEF